MKSFLPPLLVTVTFQILFSLSSIAAAQEFPEGRVVDLTYSFNKETIYWPTAEGFQLEYSADLPGNVGDTGTAGGRVRRHQDGMGRPDYREA